MRAAPVLEIARALERQLVLQVAIDELVLFDESGIEALGRYGLCISWRNSSGVHVHSPWNKHVAASETRNM